MSVVGYVVLLAIGYALSRGRRSVSLRVVLWGVGLQWAIGLLLLTLPQGGAGLATAAVGVQSVLDHAFVGSGFLFGDLSGTASLSVSVPVLLLESGFSRSHEREADAFAFDLLRRTGRSPGDFATIMRRLAEHHGDAGDGPVSYLSTHPPSEERIRAAEAAAE